MATSLNKQSINDLSINSGRVKFNHINENTIVSPSSLKSIKNTPDYTWMKSIPADDFELNSVSTVNPFLYVDEVDARKRSFIYRRKLKLALEKRAFWKSSQIQTKKYYCNKVNQNVGPQWYQDLSFAQMDLIRDLPRMMFSDLERKCVEDIRRFISELGVIPNLTRKQLWLALKDSNMDPIRFLFSVQKIVSDREQKEYTEDFYLAKKSNMPTSSFSVNERLLLSAVFFCHCPKLIEKLDKILPSPAQKPHVLWGNRLKPTKKIYKSPYLEPQPINEMCWYEERAVKDLEKKVADAIKRRKEREEKRKMSMMLKEAKERIMAKNIMDQEMRRLARKPVIGTVKLTDQEEWELLCEIEALLEAEDKFLMTCQISDPNLLESTDEKIEEEPQVDRMLSDLQLRVGMLAIQRTPLVQDFNEDTKRHQSIHSYIPIPATPTQIAYYNDPSNDPTRISATITLSNIVNGKLRETRHCAVQTLYVPEYGILRNKEDVATDTRVEESTKKINDDSEGKKAHLTYGYMDYKRPLEECIGLRKLMKNIRSDIEYLLVLMYLQREESLIPSMLVDEYNFSDNLSLNEDLMEIIGYEMVPKKKAISKQKSITNSPTDECVLEKKPYMVECTDPECGKVDDSIQEIPMDEFLLAQRKIAVLPVEKQLESAVQYLSDKGDPLAVLPQVHKIPYLIRWFELRRNIMTKLTEADKQNLLEESKALWDSSYFHVSNIPIPELNSKCNNWDHVVYLKHKANALKQKYQRKIRQQLVTNARNYFPTMKTDYYQNSKLMQSFRRTFFAYMPSKEADSLTVKPWKTSEKKGGDEGDCGRGASCRLQAQRQDLKK